MIITFPHMGDTYIPIKMILDELNIQSVIPPKSNQTTLKKGSVSSPEAICVPFKIILGNLLEGIENGADTIFMLTGCGPCRFGIFHALQQEIMLDLNREIEFLTADRFSNWQGLKEFSQRLKEASPKNTYLKIFMTMRKGLAILDQVDELHQLANHIRPREVNEGTVNALITQFERQVRVTTGYRAMRELIQLTKIHLQDIPKKAEKSYLKIAIVGEIYTLLEPYINLEIESKLGKMGVDVVRTTSASEFVREQMDFLPFIHSNKKRIYKEASLYLKTPIGGHAINTIGNTVHYSKEGFDGIIHLLPFTCMPEIVVQTILPTIEEEQNIPIMTFVLDELTGVAGYMTRLEAFVDLLEKRRAQREQSLSWH